MSAVLHLPAIGLLAVIVAVVALIPGPAGWRFVTCLFWLVAVLESLATLAAIMTVPARYWPLPAIHLILAVGAHLLTRVSRAEVRQLEASR